MNALVEAFRGRLVVSCQAYPGEAMRDPRTMAQVAQQAVRGGAAAIRVQGIEDIRETAKVIDVPLIGLWKDGTEGVFITPTLRHALACAEAGADIVAIDATSRPRPDGSTFADIVAGLRATHPDVLVMADCGSLQDCIEAEAAGADVIGTTLAGYSGDRPRTDGPDLELAREVLEACSRPVVVEGRVHTVAQAAEVMALGVHAVCVGTAITHPSTITSWFVSAVERRDA